MVLHRSQKAGHRQPSILQELALAVILAGLGLRSTVTESPQARFSATAISIFDQPYGLIVSLCLALAGLSLILLYQGRGIGWWAWAGLGTFLLAGLGSGIYAGDKRAAINSLVIQVSPIIMGLGLACGLTKPTWYRLILALAVAVGVTNTIESFNQVMYVNQAMVEQYHQDPNALLGPLGIEPNSLEGFLFEHRLLTSAGSGYLTTRNSAGLLAVISLCCLCATWLGQREGARSITRLDLIYAVAGAIILTGLVLAKAKTAVFGLAVAAVIIGCKAHKRWLRVCCQITAAVMIIAAAIGFIGLIWLGWPMPQPLLVRWQYWVATARMIRDHVLLGIGPGNFSYYYCTYKVPEAIETVADPHNLVLSIVSQYGPLGLLGWGITVLGGIRRVLRSGHSNLDLIKDDRPNVWDLIAFVVLGFTIFAIRPMVLRILQGGQLDLIGAIVPGMLVLLMMALMVAASGKPKGRHCTSTWAPILGLALLAAIATGLVDYSPFEPANATWFWAIMGCGMAYSSCSPDRPPSHKAYWPLTVTALVAIPSWYIVTRPVVISSLLISNAYKAAGDLDLQAARRYLDLAIEADRLSYGPASLQSRLIMHTGRIGDPNELELAIQYTQIAIRRNPADFRQHERLADALALIGRYQQAYQAMEQATRLYPGSERLWFRLGQLAEACNRPVEAVEFYTKAIDIERRFRQEFGRLYPDWPRPVSRLGQAQYQMGLERIAVLSGSGL